VILCDSSVWLALAIDEHDHHRAALAWLGTVNAQTPVYFCRATQQAMLRLLTTASVYLAFERVPFTNDKAWSIYDSFLADERIHYQAREPDGLESRWRQYAARDSSSPKLWMDAYLAAFARAGGYQLVTTDAGFKQFDVLDLVLLSS
jgi:toxin-antitoxin system PIN domain toxin